MIYNIHDRRGSTRQGFIVFAVLGLFIAAWCVTYFNGQPGYPDAFYHYNGAARLARGEGFVEDYLWTYQGAPASLPAPSHLYWGPGTSIVVSLGMILFGQNYPAAQIGLIACLWGASLIAYWLGVLAGGTVRHGWAAGLMTLSGGFFLRMYGATDTFTPYALFGSAALLAQGWARRSGRLRYWALAGALSAAGHLIRTDGLLLMMVGVVVALWPMRGQGDGHVGAWHAMPSGTERAQHAAPLQMRMKYCAVLLAGYLVVMGPWFARNLSAIGTILPTGGTQAVWYLTYDDLFNYPPRTNPAAFTAEGVQQLIQIRKDVLRPTLENFIAVEGMVILVPLMLIALWRRRREPLTHPLMLFALGIHLAFWLVFPWPGVRGGLFHASAALIPWWAGLGAAGVDDVVRWVARYRKHWNPRTAARLFTIMLVICLALFSWTLSAPKRVFAYVLPLYPALEAALPPDAKVMINDPSQLYYYTGRGGVTFPNEPPESILTIADVYDIDYVVVEGDGFGGIVVPVPMMFDIDAPPPFLRPVPREIFDRGEARLYEIVRDPQ